MQLDKEHVIEAVKTYICEELKGGRGYETGDIFLVSPNWMPSGIRKYLEDRGDGIIEGTYTAADLANQGISVTGHWRCKYWKVRKSSLDDDQ